MEAAWHGGFVAVPINAKLHPREFAYILDHSGAKAVLVTDDLVDAVAAAVGELDVRPRVILVGSPEHHALYDEAVPLAAVQPRVETILERSGFVTSIGPARIFWSADRAILSLGADLPPVAADAEPSGDFDATLVITPHEDRREQQL